MKNIEKYRIKQSILISIPIILLAIFVSIFMDKEYTTKTNNVVKFTEHTEYVTVKNYLLSKIKSPYLNISYNVEKGDSLRKIFDKFEVTESQAISAINLIKKFTNPNSLKTESIINIVLKKDLSGNKNLEEVIIPFDKGIIRIYQDLESEKFLSEKVIPKLSKKISLAENIIKDNLYSSATKENVEPSIIVEFARIFGFEVDFQRDIRKNDKFQIVYEKFYDENDEFVKTGKILFAYMSVNNRDINLYRFGDDKSYGYFNELGKSVEKALMKTPINGARLSSGYGKRKHPILGYTKMHMGTDFAAPLGTPIMASGTGKVIKAAWCGGGGNCIKIKHNSTYSTVYAHLSKFAKGIKAGKKVRQGQIIGYVGSTGLSTGPHLHYEVHVNGKKVNSQKLNLPSGKILKGKERQLFEVHRIKTDVLISEIIKNKTIN